MTLEEQRLDEKKLCKLFLDVYLSSKSNKIGISKEQLQNISVKEKDAARIITTWESDHLLKICRKSTDGLFSAFWSIEVNSLGIKYFEENK